MTVVEGNTKHERCEAWVRAAFLGWDLRNYPELSPLRCWGLDNPKCNPRKTHLALIRQENPLDFSSSTFSAYVSQLMREAGPFCEVVTPQAQHPTSGVKHTPVGTHAGKAWTQLGVASRIPSEGQGKHHKAIVSCLALESPQLDGM